jgi:hypothetical protein
MPAGSNYVIEILVDAKGDRVSAVTRKVGDDVDRLATRTESAGERMKRAFSGAAIALTFGRAIPFMRQAIDSSSRLQASMLGLGSAVEYAGEDFDTAQAFIESYVSDGLVPLADATNALKNLLLAGYGLEESKQMLRALKDFAAFGRQGQLSMGDAIERATQGLKNEQSVLVDNVGLTKNLSVMWGEYAEQIGKGAGSLTRAERLQATYLGTLKEWEAVAGDAKKASAGLTGEIAEQQANMEMLRATVGDALSPAYRDLLSNINPVITAVTDFAEANPKVTATLLGGAGLVAALGALAAVLTLIGPGGALLVGVTAGLVGLTGVVQKLTADTRLSNEALYEQAKAAEADQEEFNGLLEEYKDLEGRPGKSAEEHERLNKVMEALAEKVPEAVEAFDSEGRILHLNTEALEGYNDAMAIAKQLVIDEYYKRIAESQREVKEASESLDRITGQYGHTTEHILELQDRRRVLEEKIAKLKPFAYDPEVQAEIEQYERDLAYLNRGIEEFVNGQEMARTKVFQLLDTLHLEQTELNLLKEHLNELLGVTKDKNDATEDGTGKNKDDAASARDAADAYAKWTRQMQAWDVARAEMLDRPELEPDAVDTSWVTEHQEAWWKDFGEGSDEVSAFAEELDRLGERFGTWEKNAVNALGSVLSSSVDAFALIASGQAEMLDGMFEDWQSFAEAVLELLWRIILRALIARALAGIGGLFAGGGGTVESDIIGTTQSMAGGQGGGTVMRSGIRGVTGLDTIPVMTVPGETFLTPSLTNRMERMANEWENGGLESRLESSLGRFLNQSSGGRPLQVTTPDAATFRRMVRSGELGRLIREAERHDRLPR